MLQSLGKTTSYPTCYSPQSLERIERKTRRNDEGYKYEMVGLDIWNCYEFTFLQSNGVPYFGTLQIRNDIRNPYMFESKSLKLYLFSLNNEKFNSVTELLDVIRHDLAKCTGGKVDIILNPIAHQGGSSNRIFLEEEIEIDKISKYTHDSDLIQVTDFLNQNYQSISLYSNILRSNCEITNQPDFASVSIHYTPSKKILDKTSVLKYLISFRNHQEFHEHTCERIYQNIYEKLNPEHLTVICQYTRRGGIDINPIRSSDDYFNNLLDINNSLLKLKQQ